MVRSEVIRTGPAEDAGQRLTNDAASPAIDRIAAARWLLLIAIPVMTATEVTVRIRSGREADIVEVLIASSPRRP
jgi:hypothetical protein